MLKKIKFLIFVLSIPYILSAAGKEEPLWVGMLRTDGIMIPFAQYDGKTWSKCWVAPKRHWQVEMKTLNDIPADWLGKASFFPAKWFMPDADNNIELTASSAVYTKNQCIEMHGIAFDPRKISRTACDVCGVQNIAFSQKTNISTPVALNQESKTAEEIIKSLKLLYAVKPADTARKKDKQDKLYINTKKIVDHMPFVKSKATENGWTKFNLEKVVEGLYYLDASWMNPDSLDPQDPEWLAMGCWLKKTGTEYKILKNFVNKANKEIFDERGWTFRSMKSLKINNQDFIISRITGYETEEYIVFKIEKETLVILVRYFSGGC